MLFIITFILYLFSKPIDTKPQFHGAGNACSETSVRPFSLSFSKTHSTMVFDLLSSQLFPDLGSPTWCIRQEHCTSRNHPWCPPRPLVPPDREIACYGECTSLLCVLFDFFLRWRYFVCLGQGAIITLFSSVKLVFCGAHGSFLDFQMCCCPGSKTFGNSCSKPYS